MQVSVRFPVLLWLQVELGLATNDLVLLTLSRLSPEKGLDLLLDALLLWEGESERECGRSEPAAIRQSKIPNPKSKIPHLRVLICGEAAYMRGRTFVERLKRQAKRLRRVRVDFLGHVSGLRKQTIFSLAHLYVFPSRHESYGLTVVEAMSAGLSVLTSDHHSARDTVTPDCGLIVHWDRESQAPHALKEALKSLFADPSRLRRMGEAAARRAQALPFSDAARNVADAIDTAALHRQSH